MKFKHLINLLVIIALVLAICVTVDYATNITSTDINCTLKQNNSEDVILPNNQSIIGLNESESNIIVKSSDKVHIIVPKYPTISMWAKPSVRSGYSYTWYKFTWIDYCPNCKHYNALLKNPKMVPEREYTCRYCDSDFCAVTGKEKYSWSRVYLRRA